MEWQNFHSQLLLLMAVEIVAVHISPRVPQKAADGHADITERTATLRRVCVGQTFEPHAGIGSIRCTIAASRSMWIIQRFLGRTLFKLLLGADTPFTLTQLFLRLTLCLAVSFAALVPPAQVDKLNIHANIAHLAEPDGAGGLSALQPWMGLQPTLPVKVIKAVHFADALLFKRCDILIGTELVLQCVIPEKETD